MEENNNQQTQRSDSFFKILVTCLLGGITAFVGTLIWKGKQILKWAIPIVFGWWFFSDTIHSIGEGLKGIYNGVAELINHKIAYWEETSKIEDEHQRSLEKIKLETDTKIRLNESKSNIELKELQTKSVIKIEEMRVTENIENNMWLRQQTEKRNKAINESIKNGNWFKQNNKKSQMPRLDETKPVEPKQSRQHNKRYNIVENQYDNTLEVVISNIE